jgi:ABC-type nitrate/sulfonate/bicarbonate transport system substrate-binding protein
LLTQQKDLDAIVEFTGFAYKGLANPDLVDRIYAPEDYIKDEFGVDAFVTMFASRREWLEQPENAQLAVDFLEGWDLANEQFEQNLDENMEQYGRFAGLDSEAEIELIRELYADNQITRASDTWDEDYIDAQIGTLEILEKHGLVEEAAPREQAITHTELLEMAEQ